MYRHRDSGDDPYLFRGVISVRIAVQNRRPNILLILSCQAFHKCKILGAAEYKADAAHVSPIGFGCVAHDALENHIWIFLWKLNGLDSLAQKKCIRTFNHNPDAFAADIIDEETLFTNGGDGAVLGDAPYGSSAVFHGDLSPGNASSE